VIQCNVRDITERKQAEQELRKERDRSQKYLDVAGVIMVLIGVDQKIALMNKKGYDVLGYKEEELIGQNWFDTVIPQGNRGEVKGVFDRLMAGEIEPVEYFENPVLTKNRRELLMAWHNVILKDEKGNIIGTLSSGEDITERKRTEDALQESEERFRGFFELTADLVVISDIEGYFREINSAWPRVLGYSKEEILGKPFLDFVHPDDKEKTVQIITDKLKRGETVLSFENRYVRKEGGIVWLEWTSQPRVEKGYTFAIARDITERKREESKLNKVLLDLEHSNKELEQFAYVASHDLQEPLRMVASYTQLLEKRYKDQLDQDAKEFIQFAVDGAIRMQRLINDLLAYSRVGTRGKPHKHTDSHSVLGQAIVNLSTLIEENQAVVTTDDLPPILADESQMVQLFQNLISNAIKFRSGLSPRVHVSAERKENEWIFSVKDNGIGIDPQYKERIFVVFQRLHQKEEYPGTGMGLAICKKIVERHGGKIWVESELQKGSTFYFSVPVIERKEPNEDKTVYAMAERE
jgi:PAS domain S-box-containing protein